MVKEDSKKDIFENSPVWSALATMAIPSIISQLTALIYNMADTFFLGRTGNPYMVAGASLILPVFNFVIPLGNITGIGGGSLISRLLGRGEEDEASKVSAFSVIVALAFSLLFSLVMLLFLDDILSALGSNANTHGYAKQYVTCVVILGAAPTVLSNVFANLLRSAGYSKEAGIGISGGGILNIFLDPIFMYLLLPDGYEVLAVALATFLSNVSVLAYFLITMRRVKDKCCLRIAFKGSLPEKRSIREIFAIGFPSSLSVFLFDVDYIILDRLMSSYGERALAAIGIVLKVERFPLNTGVGICQGMVPLIGYNYSAGNDRRVSEIVSKARLTGLFVGFASILAYELFSPEIMSFFINDAGTVEYGSVFLRLRILATPFMFLCFFHVHFFNAVGKGGHSLFLGFFRFAVVNIPMLFLMNALFGIYGLSLSQLVSDAFVAFVSLLVFASFRRKARK